ncbi:unnamed protein product, partial [Ectocarpus sp. 12 AP-2014]
VWRVREACVCLRFFAIPALRGRSVPIFRECMRWPRGALLTNIRRSSRRAKNFLDVCVYACCIGFANSLPFVAFTPLSQVSRLAVATRSCFRPSRVSPRIFFCNSLL